MKTSYKFNAVDNYRYYLMFACAGIGYMMIMAAVLRILIPLFVTEGRVEYSELKVISLVAIWILPFLGMAFFAVCMAHLYAKEKWIISFDDKEIEIGSNRRPKKVFLISQVKKVVWYKSKKSILKNMEVSFQFEKGILPQYRISTNKSIFPRACQKNSYQQFNQFFDDFNEQILQTQFKQVTSKLVTLPLTFIQKN